MEDDLSARPCLRSGACCKVGPCPFGEWDAAKHQCKFLEVTVVNGLEIHSCGKYEEINALGPEYMAEIAPAFGAGCCMPLGNTARNTIVKAIRDGRISLKVIQGA